MSLVEQLVGRRVLAQLVPGRGAGVHEGLGHHPQASVSGAAPVHVEHELRVLDHVHPEAQGQAVALPGVAHVRIVDLVLVGPVVQGVEHVLDGQWQGQVPVC